MLDTPKEESTGIGIDYRWERGEGGRKRTFSEW